MIILFLALLFYYYSVQTVLLTSEESAFALKNNNINYTDKPAVPAVAHTNIMIFTTPDILPAIQKSGKCFTSSIAAPYRKDAWRCMIANTIYDPCFETKQNGFVFCQPNPVVSDYILIKLTQVFPKASAPAAAKDNWAWFLTLKDGTQCYPFTGTRPFFSKDQIAYYACKSNDDSKQIVLIGELIKDVIWKANKAILTKTGTAWAISTLKQVDINSVWQ